MTKQKTSIEIFKKQCRSSLVTRLLQFQLPFFNLEIQIWLTQKNEHKIETRMWKEGSGNFPNPGKYFFAKLETSSVYGINAQRTKNVKLCATINDNELVVYECNRELGRI